MFASVHLARAAPVVKPSTTAPSIFTPYTPRQGKLLIHASMDYVREMDHRPNVCVTPGTLVPHARLTSTSARAALARMEQLAPTWSIRTRAHASLDIQAPTVRQTSTSVPVILAKMVRLARTR
jgi:hypothetical protein